jgi:multisubunit Na+/H+ antiporter MnhB subunit
MREFIAQVLMSSFAVLFCFVSLRSFPMSKRRQRRRLLEFLGTFVLGIIVLKICAFLLR